MMYQSIPARVMEKILSSTSSRLVSGSAMALILRDRAHVRDQLAEHAVAPDHGLGVDRGVDGEEDLLNGAGYPAPLQIGSLVMNLFLASVLRCLRFMLISSISMISAMAREFRRA